MPEPTPPPPAVYPPAGAPYGAPQSGQAQYGAQPQYGAPESGQAQYGAQPQYGAPESGQAQYGAQPQYGAPLSGQPQYGAPLSGQPQYGQPQYGQPQYGHPQYGQAPYGYPPAVPTAALAPWGTRVGSALIDGLLPGAAMVVVQMLLVAIGDLALLTVGSLVAAAAVLAFVVWNSGYRQGTTGQSIGKKVVGTKLVLATTGLPVGFGLAIGRQFAHILDGLPFYLGYLWPLWDEQRQTFADKVCGTLVVRAGT
jgi:uncharacterized RDD family membrane protein YckC